MAMLEDLATRLTAVNSAHGTLGISLFLGYMPDTPHACLTLHSLPGSPPLETFALRPHAEVLSLQLLVRDPVYATAESRARSAWLDLLDLQDVTLSGTRYLRVSSLNSPYLLERDDTRRCIFAATFTVQRAL